MPIRQHRDRHGLPLLILLLLVVLPFAAVAEPATDRGVLLVAAPGHGGDDFGETVLLLKRHARGGTVGVIVNRPTNAHLDEHFPGITAPEGWAGHLFHGGPAEPNRLVFLVRTRSLAPRNALHVFENVFLAYDQQLLADILRHPVPLLGVRVFFGHARWARGELENAIARGEWYLVEADPESVFTDDPETLWKRLVARVEKRKVSTPGRDRAATARPATVRW